MSTRTVSSGIPNMDVTEVRMWLKTLRDKWHKSSIYNPLVGSQKLGMYTVNNFCFYLVVGHMRKRHQY